MEYVTIDKLSEDYLDGKLSEKEFVEKYNELIEKENEKRIDKSFEPHEHI